MQDHDDYQSDIEFGRWLKQQREAAGLSLEQAEKLTGIAPSRLKALEMGYAEKGIGRGEAENLSAAYRIALQTILEKAAG
jgi:transcriptional regulator with XRE-family HTH domain